jgi:hypothetical protein
MPALFQTTLAMRTFTAVIERDSETKLYVGYVPGFPGAHTQAATLDELHENLTEVRQRGSHEQFRDAEGRGTTVPYHRGRDVSPVLVRRID